MENNELIQAARSKADQIINQAHKEAAVTQQEADKYIVDTLADLEGQLAGLLNQVHNGINTLQNDRYLSSTPSEEEREEDDGLL
jgi:tRNA A37 methylthiotransferase MiaB